jgi:HAD superfamily hydrolase (TIGR01549 family)
VNAMPSRRRQPLAVTFDLWNTLLLRPSEDFTAIRARRLAEALRVAEGKMCDAIVEGQSVHDAEWRAGRCWGATGLAELLTDRFGLHVPRAQLLDLIESSGVGAGELVVEGAAEVLTALRSAGIGLGLVSDTGVSPGRVLRRILATLGIADNFNPKAMAFSDEVGVPKPHPRMFQRALAALDVEPAEAVHIGDLRLTDVAGGKAVGMRTVRFVGCKDDRGVGPEGDYVVKHLRDLPIVLGITA